MNTKPLANTGAKPPEDMKADSKANSPEDSKVSSPGFWDEQYKKNHFPWDLGGPTPVFRRLAQKRRFKPGRMLVLGAGRGHDARLFARHGFKVTAVDFSAGAVGLMGQLNDPSFPVEIVQADFFTLIDKWNNLFDYILDYTSFCAVLPSRRAEYADLVTRLLKPAGRYIILAFPIGARPGGPPYSLQPDAVIELYSQRGFRLLTREDPSDSVPDRKGYEQLIVLKKI